MVDTIQPRQVFPISRLLTDPTDNNTYYLSAVIRNAATGAIIDTKNLSQISGRLYGATYQMPADPSGQGLFITITTLVYTDSGRTTKSDVYGEEHEAFLIYDRFHFAQNLASQINALQTGTDIDYKRIAKIIKLAVEEIKIPEPIDVEKVDLSPVISEIRAVGARVEQIDIPEPQELTATDLAPVLSRIDDAQKEIKTATQEIMDSIESSKGEKTDLTPLISEINKIQPGIIKEITAKTQELIDKLENLVSSDLGDSLENIKKIKETMFEFLFNFNKMTAPKEPTGPKNSLNGFGNVVKRNE